MSSVEHLSYESFQREVLLSSLPVLVDFYADWCGPCRMLGPTLDRLAREFSGRVKVVKVNVDKDLELADQYRVESIPSLLLFIDGEVVGRTTGVIPEGSLRQALDQCVAAVA
jgi:thioredoxin 1